MNQEILSELSSLYFLDHPFCVAFFFTHQGCKHRFLERITTGLGRRGTVVNLTKQIQNKFNKTSIRA